jgi:hypothetical protein
MAQQLHPENETRDNKRAFRWGAIAFAVLLALAVGYNMLSHERAGPLNPETPTQQAAPEPSQGGAAGAGAGPGTGAGTGTSAASGTGTPRP